MGKRSKVMTFDKIRKGQCNYKVIIDLKSLLDKERLEEFRKNFDEMKKNKDFNKICKFNREKLEYTSETLLPSSENIDDNKTKVLFILGNPATHSIINKMFYYSQTNEKKRHGFWKKLYNGGLLDSELEIRKLTEHCTNDKTEILKIEACKRREYILSGNTSNHFVLGLTTFYSLPTPVGKNVKAVEDLFKGTTNNEKLLNQIRKEELKRIQSYNFTTNAIWVFTQGSSYRFVRNTEEKCLESLLYWPMFERSNKSSGEYLKKMLKNREKA